MRRFFVDQSNIARSQAVLTKSDARHIQQVLRLKPGEKILLFDGSGYEYESIIQGMSNNKITVTLGRRLSCSSESPLILIVAQAILKDRKMDTLVRQLTELGITKWFPFAAERSVVRPDAGRLAARKQRWEKIATESLKQCKRGCVPQIGTYRTFEKAISYAENCDLKIIFHQDGVESLMADPVYPDMVPLDMAGKKIFLMFGPEGGFSQNEIDMADDKGFIIARLGPRILRAETAPVAACAIVQYLFGDMGAKNS